jgi:hypothetical protein
MNCDVSTMKQLLEQHVKLNFPDATGLDPLHLATMPSDMDNDSSSSSSAMEEETTR